MDWKEEYRKLALKIKEIEIIFNEIRDADEFYNELGRILKTIKLK